jgi:cyclic pyranopterin phosphate synthase
LSKLTHIDETGRARMVDVSQKPSTAREAVAEGFVHPLAITKAEVRVEAEDAGLRVTARVKTTGQTGVEMEALTAVTVACLTLYDMLKAAQKTMVIEGVRLVSKSGGKSGDWTA